SEQYYYRARYYSGNGRFNRRDPAGDIEGQNLYIYVENQALNAVDPSGNIAIKQGDTIPVNHGQWWIFKNLWFMHRCGTITVDRYRAIHAPRRYGGAHLSLTFTWSTSCACCPGNDWRWIQTVTEATGPFRPADAPFNDPQPPNDTLPYYFTNAVLPSFRTATSLRFRDTPLQPYRSLLLQDSVVVRFELDLVCASKSDEVFQTIHWGYKYYLSWWGWGPDTVKIFHW
ncbi:MAG: RHS repeat-associated core domain-containing protein, partial [Planctomycetota bacterium]